MRLYTHSDLDGVFCAALLSECEEVDEIRFVDPATVQAGKIRFRPTDIIADLPFCRGCGMWFDHHESSRPKEGQKFEGSWKLAPSAARVVYDWCENPYLEKYASALQEVDLIDSGKVPREQAENPSGWFLLSNTLESEANKKEDDEYRRHVIGLLRKNPDIKAVLADATVAARAEEAGESLAKFASILKECTVMIGRVAYSDLRRRPDFPRGNNYLVYSLFPQAVSSVRLMPVDEEAGTAKISVGHNVYGEKCGFDVGMAMKKLGGGGHRGVGGASVKKDEAEALAEKLVKEINESCAQQ